MPYSYYYHFGHKPPSPVLSVYCSATASSLAVHIKWNQTTKCINRLKRRNKSAVSRRCLWFSTTEDSWSSRSLVNIFAPLNNCWLKKTPTLICLAVAAVATAFNWLINFVAWKQVESFLEFWNNPFAVVSLSWPVIRVSSGELLLMAVLQAQELGFRGGEETLMPQCVSLSVWVTYQ